MRYLISVAYDGSKFYGFQRQKDKPSVQKEIEKSLKKVTKKDIEIKGAGRTDRGVHAIDQKCHFDLDIKITSHALKKAINTYLNEYIYIKNCKQIANDFHARFLVKEKEYLYKINLGEYNPLLEDYTLQTPYSLNIKNMKKAAKYFIGIHNFRAFVCGKRENYETTIYKIKFKKEKEILHIYFKGKNFYNYMVRNMIGALIEVGRGKMMPIKIKELLQDGKYDDTSATAKANGLYLNSIKY